MNTMRFRTPIVFVVCSALFLGCGGGDPYQGMDADALFRLAVVEFEEGDHDNAVDALDRLLIAFGDWPRVPEARLLLADIHFDDGDYLTARADYERFLDRFVGHGSAPDAAIGVCRSLSMLTPAPGRDQGYTLEAIAACRDVSIDYQGLPQAIEAVEISNRLRATLAEKEFDVAEFYFRRGAPDSAIRYYEFVANLYPETEWAPKALLGVYEANREIGYDDLAEAARARLLAEYPDSESAAVIRGDSVGG